MNIYRKAHFTFLESITDRQMAMYYPCWIDQSCQHSEDRFCPVEYVFWAALAVGNDELALAEDDSEDQ